MGEQDTGGSGFRGILSNRGLLPKYQLIGWSFESIRGHLKTGGISYRFSPGVTVSRGVDPTPAALDSVLGRITEQSPSNPNRMVTEARIEPRRRSKTEPGFAPETTKSFTPVRRKVQDRAGFRT